MLKRTQNTPGPKLDTLLKQFALDGRLLKRMDSNSATSVQVDLAGLSADTYLVRVRLVDGAILTRHIVKIE